VVSGGVCGKGLEVDIVDKFGYSKGKLKKVHNGCYNELCTTADRYEITLP
jgi:hypothetical protein